MIQPTVPVASPPLTPRPASEYCMVLKRELRRLLDELGSVERYYLGQEFVDRMEALADE